MTDPKQLLFANWRECVVGNYPGISEAEIATALALFEAAWAPLVRSQRFLELPSNPPPHDLQLAATNALLALLHLTINTGN